MSAVRHQFPIAGIPITVVQTQAPINPGNSGGPILTTDGRLVAVVFGQWLQGRYQAPSLDPAQEIVVPAAGVNLAIGVNEVSQFVDASVRR